MPPFSFALRDWRALTHYSLRGAVFAVTAFLWPIAAGAGQLSLDQAQQIAVQRSRQVAAQDDAISASREMAVVAGQLPDPVLKLGIDNLPVSGTDRGSLTSDFMTMRRIGVMQEITRDDKRMLRARRSDLEVQRNLAEKDVVIAAVERDTAIAWLERYYAEAMEAVVVVQRSQADQEKQVLEAAYRSGRASQGDVLAARSSIVEFDDRLDEAARRVRNAKLILARWVGSDMGDVPDSPPAIDKIRFDPAMLDSQIEHHPEIAVRVRDADIADTEVKLADAGRKSDWTVELAWQQRGPAYSNMISFGVSIPLQWDQKNRQDRELAAKYAKAQQANAERDEMQREHTVEIQVMFNEWQTDLHRMQRYTRDQMPLAQERTQAALAAYRGGKGTLTDVLAARRNELEVHLSSLQLEADTAKLWAQLNFLFPAGHVSASGASGDSK